MTAMRAEILARYEFELDRFQLEALDALDAGQHVIVAAPTGSGKTVVAEYGIDRARRLGKRAFYTAPIKALSNQKFRDLVELHGAENVGLLTGDTTINHGAPILVMTTEVLRNMIYADLGSLNDVGAVVLDEVHFLQDTYRGPVWEEVIIHLPAHVQLICLSATVSNHAQLGDWVRAVRGPTRVVLEQKRPVTLENFYLVGDRINQELRMMPVVLNGQANPKGFTYDLRSLKGRGPQRDSRRERRVVEVPNRIETLRLLDAKKMLPAIWFIFSRNQCDVAAQACVDAGVVLTDQTERERITEIATERLTALRNSDLEVLGVTNFLARLQAGIAAHHAGLLPAFKEVVEACFVEGLIKVVFATETLAVGINMPARTVVIEKLTKFTGDHHESLTAGEYTQLTGRAGRRGIDQHGSAVVLWNPFVQFGQIVELVQSRSFHLRSAFRPTYNMAANLIRTHTRPQARQVLSLSFAQFQSNAEILRSQTRLRHLTDRVNDLRGEAHSPYGDIEDYRSQRSVESAPIYVDDAISAGMAAQRPGNVIRIDVGKHHCPAAIVAVANRRSGVKLSVVTPGGDLVRVHPENFSAPPVAIGQVKLPPVHAPERKEYRREVSRRLRTARLDRSGAGRDGRSDSRADRSRGIHPVELDPDLEHRLRAAKKADAVEREISHLLVRLETDQHGLAAQFDKVVGILSELGYVDAERWALTPAGEILSHIFHESDLLIAECVRTGLLEGLSPAELACLVSMFVYEHRSPDEPPSPWFPNDNLRRRAEQVLLVSNRLATLETVNGISPHRPPDPTFAAVAYAWVAGEGFAELVQAEDLTGGDFVRTIKQLIDVLTQIGRNAPDAATRAAANSAAEAAYRGVIADAAITVVTTSEEISEPWP
jgi:ATP-dependent RNA helicase HelY